MADNHRGGIHISAISSRDNTRILGRATQRASLHPNPELSVLVGFAKSSDPRTGADIGIINKCYLTHDCRSSINIEYDVVNSIKHV